MSDSLLSLLISQREAFSFFEEAFLFGSALYNATPNDIDIVLVYEDAKLPQVQYQLSILADLLTPHLGEYGLDFTTLSASELLSTDFLNKVQYRRIK